MGRYALGLAVASAALTAGCATVLPAAGPRPAPAVATASPATPAAGPSTTAPTPAGPPAAAATPAGPPPAAGAPDGTVESVPVVSMPPAFPIPEFAPLPIPEAIPLTADVTPFLHRIPTTQPVAFLTIDDGYTKTAVAPQILGAAHVPVTLFLTGDAVKENPEYFRPMRSAGAVIEDHTITHPELRGRSYGYQRHQICDSADYLATTYGRRPVLFRPPFGDADATTLRAAHDCGMRAVFGWTETVDKGIVRYQTPDHHVRAGDIILMHFRPAFEADFLAALNAIHRSGLSPARLDDYLQM